MPCGFVLVAARLNVGGWFLIAGKSGGRPVILVNFVRAGVHNPDVIDIVWIDCESGWRWICRRQCPAAFENSRGCVAEDLVSGERVVQNPQVSSVRDDVRGIQVA
jgi:hypothetical protein